QPTPESKKGPLLPPQQFLRRNRRLPLQRELVVSARIPRRVRAAPCDAPLLLVLRAHGLPFLRPLQLLFRLWRFCRQGLGGRVRVLPRLGRRIWLPLSSI